MVDKSEIAGIILAGGKASRMAFQDKPLQLLHGEPLLSHVIKRAEPQVQRLLLSVNHNPESYRPFGLPLVADRDSSYAGPLLGIYSAMRWYLEQQDARGIKYLACFAADVPEFPTTIVAELAGSIDKSGVAYAHHQGQIQPLFSLWRLDLSDHLEEALDAGLFGPKLLFESLGAAPVEIEDDTPGSFFNINRSEDLERARLLPNGSRA